jgi:hypothetical protein
MSGTAAIRAAGSDPARIGMAVKVALRTMIACGALLLALGLIVWTGNGDALVPVHVALGVVLVVSLWRISWIASRAGVPSRIVALAAGWGALVVLLGLAHEELVPGTWHWTVQIAHVLISMGSIAWGRRLARLIGRAMSADARPGAGDPTRVSR